jgi:hypothetical protein
MPCDLRDPGDKAGIIAAALCARPSGNQKSVDGTLHLTDGSCVGQHDTAIGLKSTFRAGACKLDLVIRGIGKHFQWTCHVEDLNGCRSGYNDFSHMSSLGERSPGAPLRTQII